jgi:hypothetical protein
MPNAARTLSRFLVSAACALGLNGNADAQAPEKNYHWNDVATNFGAMTPLRSLHSDRTQGYNEFNPGFIAMYDTPWKFGPFKDNALFLGGYKNSFAEQSYLTGIKSLAPVNRKETIEIGAVVGAVTGYSMTGRDSKPMPMISPVTDFRIQEWISATLLTSYIPGTGTLIAGGITMKPGEIKRRDSRPVMR